MKKRTIKLTLKNKSETSRIVLTELQARTLKEKLGSILNDQSAAVFVGYDDFYCGLLREDEECGDEQ